jgi:hypothetical protein
MKPFEERLLMIDRNCNQLSLSWQSRLLEITISFLPSLLLDNGRFLFLWV